MHIQDLLHPVFTGFSWFVATITPIIGFVLLFLQVYYIYLGIRTRRRDLKQSKQLAENTSDELLTKGSDKHENAIREPDSSGKARR